MVDNQRTLAQGDGDARDTSRADHRALLRSALETIERTQAKLNAVERARTEPIAVIGMSCRFPGSATSPEEYWKLMREGRGAIQEPPAGRWDGASFARLSADAAARMPRQFGGFVEDLDRFDPGLFGISPREAVTMDPQQRMLLEVSWEAVERAGYAPDRLAESLTGVFVGITASDYAQLIREADPTRLDVYYATGNGNSVAAGRISYLLGLRGPAVAVDTACSSSLAAIHLACQSLRQSECDMALAGGVNAILIPDVYVCLAKAGTLAPDGRCKAFDADADGFVRAEGCGVLVLKRLSKALADQDPVLAILRGSALNQDGASGGLTVPNGMAQQAVLRQALAAAGVSPGDVDYIEAHGTGTSLGDPIEIEAIDAVMSEGRTPGKPLVVGSVKSNIGHLESAAGVAGLMKVILALQQREIPANLHFKSLNPRITLQRLKVLVPVEPLPWRTEGKPRRAGVSSFGFSGTNAHVVVEEAPPVDSPAAEETPAMSVLTLSAKSEPALRSLVSRYREHLSGQPATSWADMCFTSNVGRSHFSHRLAAVASSEKEGLDLLAALETGGPGSVARGTIAGDRPKVAFLFTGQGAQYPGMGRALLDTNRVFREAIERCEEILKGQLDCPLLSIMYPEDGSNAIDETGYTQPALFAFEYAMAELWKSWGVIPDLAIGHSLGEYVAACIAGVFSLEDALTLVAARGRLMQALPKGGAMASIFAAEERVHESLRPYRDRVSIAALNGPRNVVISGDASAVAEILTGLSRQGIEAKRLAVSHAFHSPLIEPVLDAFERVAEGVSYSRPSLPVVSNVTGELADPAEITTARYWRRHVRSTVRFADGIAVAAAQVRVFLEVGPSPSLMGMGRECLPESGHTWIPSCRRGKDDRRQVAEALATSYAAGVAIDWQGVHRACQRRRVLLPTYPFERTRYWIEPRAGHSKPVFQNRTEETIHPFFDLHVASAQERDTHLFEGEISLDRFPYLADHCVQGRAVFPATAYSELGLAAKRIAFGGGPVALQDMEYESPILLDESKRVRVQVRLEKTAEGGARFTVFSRPTENPAAEWTMHARGKLQPVDAPETCLTAEEFAEIKGRCGREVDGAEFYRQLSQRGNQWGTLFQGVQRLWCGDGEALGMVSVPEGVASEMERYEWHPAVADTCGHPLVGTIPLEPSDGPRGGAFVGGNIGDARLYAPLRGRHFWAHARLCEKLTEPSNVLTGDLRLLDENLNIVSEVRGARLWYLDRTSSTRAEDWIYSLRFDPAPEPSSRRDPDPAKRRWAILTDRQGVGERLKEALETHGDEAVLIHRGEDSGPDDLSAAPAAHSEPQDHYFGIVHLWGLDSQVQEAATAGDIEGALAAGAESALRCMKGLASSSNPQPPRLWMVTRGAQSAGAGDELADPAQSAIWGLAKSFAVEHPSLWGGIVDLDPKAPAAESSDLLAETIRRSGSEDQMALRAGRVLAARLVRARLSPFARRFGWRPDATYLITGGLGGLGLRLAAWLVKQGVRHLALIGRTPLPPRAQWPSLTEDTREGRRVKAIERLESAGAKVFAGCADVGNQQSLNACVAELSRCGFPQVRGAIHTAGVLSHASLQAVTLEDFRDNLHAKAVGGWLLHKWSIGKELDCCVFFSSASAILNSPFVGAYATANAFLDGLAHRRSGQGLAALSINWGLWGGVGMAEGLSASELDTVESRGMGSIPADAGFEIFGRLTQQQICQLSVLPVDWEKWKRLFPAFVGIPFLKEVTGAAAAGSPEERSGRRVAIAAATGSERHDLVREVAIGHIAAVLGFPEGELDENVSLSRLGFDSLMATELRSRLEAETGCSLPLVRLLEGPSPAQVVVLLEAAIDSLRSGIAAGPGDDHQTSAGGTVRPDDAGRMLDQLDELSDKDVDAMLQEMLREQETTS